MTALAWAAVAIVAAIFAILAAGALAPIPNDPQEREE